MTWNLLGNPVVLAGVDAGTGDEPSFYLDTWDGFPDARVRLIGQLAGADNPVVLTGDYHAGMVLDVHERPFEDTPVVCTELMAPPISSPLFPADVSARTPSSASSSTPTATWRSRSSPSSSPPVSRCSTT